MKKNIKKLLSFALAISMVLSLFMGMSLTARAEDGVEYTWATLKAALETDGNTIKLGGDVTASDTDEALEVPYGKTVTLDLNGHTIDRGLSGGEAKEKGYVIMVKGSLTLQDTSGKKDADGNDAGKITGGNNASTDIFGGGVAVKKTGFLQPNGYVTIFDGGSFTLNGGNITGNKTVGLGGGVGVESEETFTMNGGSIIGNTAQDGGGVFADNFTMTGGIITGNSASNGGGGVSAVNFNMTGGSITKNNSNNNGGGVYVATGIMSGGSITGNSASQGGGVYVQRSGTFTMSGTASIEGNTASNGGGVGAFTGSVITIVGGVASQEILQATSEAACMLITLSCPAAASRGIRQIVPTKAVAEFLLETTSP